MRTNRLILICFLLFFLLGGGALRATADGPRYSVAGFYPLADSGREVWSLNPAWRFHRGDVADGGSETLDDSRWAVVSLPDGIELLPDEASGCVNYQGPVWYRKHFVPEERLRGKRLFVHFEGIMGKSEIWLNGERVLTHYGGFLPAIVDVTGRLRPGADNLLAVRADNSDDPSYPPGKAQDVLDFCYFGGIYRDCWLIAHHPVHITDPNFENEEAGGGLFVSYDKVSEQAADVRLALHVRNDAPTDFAGRIEYVWRDTTGAAVQRLRQRIAVKAGQAERFQTATTLKRPHLWSPESPYLYRLEVKITDSRGRTVDGYAQRIGVRSIEFRGADGFWLNGRPYESKLIGANRHQDFAVIGNALPNNLHWRDAKKLRDAGLKVIRNAHYPQDPAFMDACDELGLFVIVNTPGWQFWNKEPSFAERVYDNIRQMVRRDRNHACVWLWEPILNETWYPEDFARRAKETVEAEYPFPYCYTACDERARGSQFYRVRFRHPANGNSDERQAPTDSAVTYFTREWGDHVDNWNSHNSPSRVSRSWGEVPMLVQARHYGAPPYRYTCYETLCQTPRQHVGGTLWHSFDHQRGYHPDPFYGGIMDAYRQPKTSYYLFCAQRDPDEHNPLAESGPMVHIANALTPFSPADVTVFSNCDTVRLITFGSQGDTLYYYRPAAPQGGMPHPAITFKDVFSHEKDKAMGHKGKEGESYLLAEGLRGGQVVAAHKLHPARRPVHLLLEADLQGRTLQANGSDIVTVVASVTDHRGTIKRLNNSNVRFWVEGEGELVADGGAPTHPHRIEWGTAPILLRSTTRPGTVRVHASVIWPGKHTPTEAVLELTSVAPEYPLLFRPSEEAAAAQCRRQPVRQTGPSASALSAERLKEVERQQKDFE